MIEQASLDTLFNNARTHSYWQEKDISDDILQHIYDLTKMAPTSANCQPLRITFVKSPEAKERLKPCLAEGNVDKTMTAPVTAIIAHDLEFYNHLPEFFPHTDAKSWFVGNDEYIATTAFRNGSLQGGYFIIAARALGLDCGPMSGFDNEKLDATFFAGTAYKSNFLCNLGYGNSEKLHTRNPRPEFNQMCSIL